MNVYDSMFFAYLKELEGQDAIATEFGFITFRISGDECHVHNFYVAPAFRGDKKGKTLFSSVKQRAKEAGAQIISCNICKTDKGWKNNIKMYESQGFNIISQNENWVTMLKEI